MRSMVEGAAAVQDNSRLSGPLHRATRGPPPPSSTGEDNVRHAIVYAVFTVV